MRGQPTLRGLSWYPRAGRWGWLALLHTLGVTLPGFVALGHAALTSCMRRSAAAARGEPERVLGPPASRSREFSAAPWQPAISWSIPMGWSSDLALDPIRVPTGLTPTAVHDVVQRGVAAHRAGRPRRDDETQPCPPNEPEVAP